MRYYRGMILALAFSCSVTGFAQEGIKVVPIGQTIKPEAPEPPPAKPQVEPGKAAEAPAKKNPTPRRVSQPQVVKAGTELTVALATAVSSALTKKDEVVFVRALGKVGPGNQGLIATGALGRGTVTEVQNDKEKGKVVIQLDSIDTLSGGAAKLNGQIVLQGEKNHAAGSVGDPFTVSIQEKISGKPVRKVKTKTESTEVKGAAEVRWDDLEANLKKGKAKGKAQLIVEAPAGVNIEEVQPETLQVYRVNGVELPNPVEFKAEKPKLGDKNGNGAKDWFVQVGTWDFIKQLPRGENRVEIRGSTKGGAGFVSEAKVKIDY